MASGTFVSGVSERVTETVAGGRVNGLVVSGSCAVRLSGTQPHASAYIVHLPARNMARVVTHGGRGRQERWSCIRCRRMGWYRPSSCCAPCPVLLNFSHLCLGR